MCFIAIILRVEARVHRNAVAKSMNFNYSSSADLERTGSITYDHHIVMPYVRILGGLFERNYEFMPSFISYESLTKFHESEADFTKISKLKLQFKSATKSWFLFA